MFNQILALDVAQRIPNFVDKMREFSPNEPVIVRNEHDGSLSSHHRSMVDAIVVSIYEDVTEPFLKQFPALRYVGVLGTSTKKIAVEYCRLQRITLSNVVDYCDDETAEWVMFKIIDYFRTRPSPLSVRGKLLGVVGVGSVGRKVIERARAFDMKVLFNAQSEHQELCDLGAERLSKEEMLSRCDIISCHTPPFVSWLNSELLTYAKKDLCLINTCMGKISLGRDLEEFLAKRSDVTLCMDKIAGDNYPELLLRAHVSPVTAFNTIDSQNRLIEKFCNNLKAYS